MFPKGGSAPEEKLGYLISWLEASKRTAVVHLVGLKSSTFATLG